MLMHEKMCPSLEKSDLIQVIIQDANGGKYKWFGTEVRKFLKSSIAIRLFAGNKLSEILKSTNSKATKGCHRAQ